MGSFTNAWEDKILNHVLNKSALAQPSEIWLALSTTTIAENATGITEPSTANGYARQRITGANWAFVDDRHIENSQEIVFPVATPAGWQKITDFGAYTAQTGGEMIGYGKLQLEKIVSLNQITRLGIGAVDIKFKPGGISDYLARKMLDHVFRGDQANTGYTAPTNFYTALTLLATPPTDASTGSTLAEPDAANNYARKLHNTWTVSAGGSIFNSSDVVFNTVQNDDWGNAGHVSILDALTGGNLLLWGALANPVLIGNGDTPRFSANALGISLN